MLAKVYKFPRIKKWRELRDMKWIDLVLKDWASWVLEPDKSGIRGLSYSNTSISHKIMTEAIRTTTQKKPTQRCKETRTMTPITPFYQSNDYLSNVNRHIDRLPKREKYAIRMKYNYNAPNNLIAMGILNPKGDPVHVVTVSNILHRAKLRLVKSLTKY